jgi:hypothetical protein
MVLAAVFYMMARVASRIRGAAVPAPVSLHVMFAAFNFCVAGTMGVLIAVNKTAPFLPGSVLTNVFAHAHLATIGWAVMMALGVAYRLLPMILPAKMPPARLSCASAILLEAGVLGLFATLMLQSRWSLLFGVVICAGLMVCGWQVVWMLRHRVSKAPAAPRVDFAVWHAAGAGVSLLGAAMIGLTLLILPMSTRTLQAAAAYGVLGLIGFLGQLIVAMQTRLLPMAAWYWTDAPGGDTPSPLTMRDRTLQSLVFGGWTVGVPSLAGGLFFESASMVALGACALFAAVAIGALDSGLVVISTFHRSLPRAPFLRATS